MHEKVIELVETSRLIEEELSKVQQTVQLRDDQIKQAKESSAQRIGELELKLQAAQAKQG